MAAGKEVKNWAMSPEGTKQIAATPEGQEFAGNTEPSRANLEAVLGKGVDTTAQDRADLAKAVREFAWPRRAGTNCSSRDDHPCEAGCQPRCR